VGSKGHIWVCEDEKLVRSTLRRVLEMNGYQVSTDNPTPDTLQALLLRPFDVLITDIVMPGVGGLELIRASRKIRPGLGIVAISGGSRDLPAAPALQASLAMGAGETLFKPFSNKELLSAVARVFPQ